MKRSGSPTDTTYNDYVREGRTIFKKENGVAVTTFGLTTTLGSSVVSDIITLEKIQSCAENHIKSRTSKDSPAAIVLASERLVLVAGSGKVQLAARGLGLALAIANRERTTVAEKIMVVAE